jgi:hypothetical protein
MDVFPRLRDTLTRGLGKRLLTPSPDAGRGKVAKDAKPRRGPRLRSGQVGVNSQRTLSPDKSAGQVRGRAEGLVR